MYCIINCCKSLFISLVYIEFHVLVLFCNSKILEKTLLVSVMALPVFSKHRPSWQSPVFFLFSWPCVWNGTPLPSLCLCSACGLGPGRAALMSWALCEPPEALSVWHWMGILWPELHRLSSVAAATAHAPAPGKGWWSRTAAENGAQDLGLIAGQSMAVLPKTQRGDRILKEVKVWLHSFVLQCSRTTCIQVLR